jgi:hypothetical protein
LQEGLYKVEFHTVHGTGNGVIYATSGKLRGGNSGFAFIGNYTGKGEEIVAKVSTRRHNDDPDLKPLFGTDMITHAEGNSGWRHGRLRGHRAATARRHLQGSADPNRRLSKLPAQIPRRA